MRTSKYDGRIKRKRKKGKKGAIEEFDAAARARGMTYAQAQVEETCKLLQKRFVVPAHYRKVGERSPRRRSPF